MTEPNSPEKMMVSLPDRVENITTYTKPSDVTAEDFRWLVQFLELDIDASERGKVVTMIGHPSSVPMLKRLANFALFMWAVETSVEHNKKRAIAALGEPKEEDKT